MVAEGAVVCDASVLAAIAFVEPHSAEALSLTRSQRLYAPALLRCEMAHLSIRKCIAKPDQAHLIEREFVASLRVPVRLVEPSWLGVFRLAQTSRLSAYDAAYLELAMELRIPLATLDRRLARAAEAFGVMAAPRVECSPPPAGGPSRAPGL